MLIKLSIALAATLVSGCTVQEVASQLAPDAPVVATNDERPVCDAAIVVVIDGETTVCNVNPPSRLDVRFPGSDGIEQDAFQARCDDMGGALAWSTSVAPSGEFVCEGVDY